MNKHFEDITETTPIEVESSKKFDSVSDTDSPKNKLMTSIEKMEEKSKENCNETINSSDRELKAESDKIKIAEGNSDILEWDGEAGNSKRKPKEADSELAKELSEYGVDGIEYKDGNVDFSPVSKYDVDFENVDELYKAIGEDITIGDLMTENTVKSRSDLNDLVRNKWQDMAKQQIVDKIGNNPEFASDFQDKTGIDVGNVQSVNSLSNELKRNGLTMHETPDCKKIQFVPTDIHNAFKHSGGTAEMLERLLDGDTHGRINNN